MIESPLLRNAALALWGVNAKSTYTSSIRPDPHPIRDFFIRDLIDYAPKDHPDMMERPFFAIAKRKRLRPIVYENADGSVWIKVSGHPEHGMATIWDADILIFCISKIVAARDAGDNDFGPSIFVSPYELLKSIARETGGKNYQELMAAIKRLKTTTIETNIRGGKNRIAMFNWLAEVEGEGREAENPEQLKTLELRVSNWLFKGIMSGKGVLTLDREWFLLKGGLERVIYRIARKHAGEQAHGWTCKFETLYQKTGSEEPIRNFAVRLRKIIKKNTLPRYAMRLTKTADGSEAVHFIARSFVEAPAATVSETLGQQMQTARDQARTIWVDSGRNPRGFEATWNRWLGDGHEPSEFMRIYKDPEAATR
jgi:plasmid replication initiation protein